jgi:hypothetical protein
MKPLLNRLLLGQKFLLLALIGALLVIAPLTLFVRESNKAISAAELEAGAIQPLQTLLKVVQLTQHSTRHLAIFAIAWNFSV